MWFEDRVILRNKNRKLGAKWAQKAGLDYNGLDHSFRKMVVENMDRMAASTQEISSITGHKAGIQNLYKCQTRMEDTRIYAHQSIVRTGRINLAEYQLADKGIRLKTDLKDEKLAQMENKIDSLIEYIKANIAKQNEPSTCYSFYYC